MKRREFLVKTSAAAVAATAVTVAAQAAAPAKKPDKVPVLKKSDGLPEFTKREGYNYRWARIDRIEEMLNKDWDLVNQYDMEAGLTWPHVGGLQLMRKRI